MIVAKSHSSQQGKIICLTDSSLIGKKFEDDKTQLDFSNDFYKGEEKPVPIIEKMLTSAYIAIFSGKDSVALGIKLGIVDGDSVRVINGVEHVQCLIG
jgi:hypothetical protein